MEEYLQYAEEQVSELTKSFWFGKFLQTLSDEVLLSCREHAQTETVQQQEHSASHPMEETLMATRVVCNRKNVVSGPTGCGELPLWLHVQRAGRSMQSSETSLSPLVHELVVQSMRNASDVSLPSLSVLREDHTLDWNKVAVFLGNDIVHERREFRKGAVKCGALAKYVCHVLTSLPSSQPLWDGLFAWTGNDQVFVECVQLLRSASDESHDHTHLSLLLCSAALERALGDVYLSISRASQCPSLLRDLLNTQELQSTFGPAATCCLRCLIGPPSGLNLRNLLWHGFPSPGEICPDYGYLLLAVTASLSEPLGSSPPLLEIVNRSPVELRQAEAVMAGTFPELCEGDVEKVRQLFSASFFVPPSMLPLWLAGLTAFTDGRYHHSLVLLLPGLEHGLRRVFASVNHCPHRVLTAESTVLYTTFDEILSPVLPDITCNALQTEIGHAKLGCLLDILVHPEGPRLRDRISHGEVDFYQLSKCVAGHLISVLALFCAQYCLDHSLATDPAVVKYMELEKRYTSLFHPLSLLRRELLELVDQLESWSSIPLPAPDQAVVAGQQLPHSPSQVSLASLSSCSLDEFSTAVVGLTEPCYGSVSENLTSALHLVTRLHHNADLSETGEFSAALRGLVVQVWSEGVSTLHCPRAQLQLTGVMRRTTHNTTRTLSQIRGMAVLRYEQHLQKQLRSRQRKNYEHLVTSLPTYRGALCLLVVMMVITSSHLQPLTITDARAKKAIKFHKKLLQLSENLFSQTSSSKNCWEEADTHAHTLTLLASSHPVQDILRTAI